MPPKVDKQDNESTASIPVQVYGTMGTLAEFRWTVTGEYIKKKWNNFSWLT